MTEIQCSRCGSTKAALDRAPLPGKVGQSLVEQTCGDCWTEWMELQVKLMNEHHLSPADPEHYDRLVREMKVFLSLQED